MKIWINIVSIMLISIIVLTPASAFGEETVFEFVPKPAWEVCGEQACMDFESAQNLTRMRAQYTTLFDLVPLLELEVQSWRAMAETALEVSQMRQDVYDQLFTLYTDLERDLETVIHERNRARQFSVFKLSPYLVAGAAAVFVGGVYLGAKL